jgi:hypothetical protein
MSRHVTARVKEYFAELTDPRDESKVVHPLINFVTIALCAVLSGADEHGVLPQLKLEFSFLGVSITSSEGGFHERIGQRFGPSGPGLVAA